MQNNQQVYHKDSSYSAAFMHVVKKYKLNWKNKKRKKVVLGCPVVANYVWCGSHQTHNSSEKHGFIV